MSVRFIFGRAGSGKTSLCFKEIKKDLLENKNKNNLVFLTPEQATFVSEMELSKDEALKGIIRAQVFGFRRLAWRVLQETGGGLRVHIDDLGKKMIIRKFLENNLNDLRIFSTNIEQVGFIDKVTQAISEFKSYQVASEDLQGFLSELEDKENLVASKINDLHIVYQELEEYLENRYTDPDDYLKLLAEKIKDSNYIKNTEFWIDGFNGYTPQELSVLEELFIHAKKVNISLTIDPDDLDLKKLKNRCFKNTKNTLEEIMTLVRRNNIQTEILKLDKNIPYRFEKSKELAILEKDFFNFMAEKNKIENKDIHLSCGQNLRAEVESVARKIRDLVRSGKYAYKDLGVYVRNFNDYDLLVETIFPFYDIPFFIDRKHSILHHPVVELLRAVLEIIEEGWNYERVFRYLKTDLIDLERNEVDILENFCLSQGIQSSTWYTEESWLKNIKLEYLDEKYLEIDSLRDKALANLRDFYKRMKKEDTGRGFSKEIYDFLISLNVPEKLEDWYNYSEKKGDLRTSRVHAQVWDGIINILEQLAEILEDEEVEIKKLSKIISSGLESLQLGIIPPSLDQVVVGSIDRSRSSNLKVMFLMGISEGVFPSKISLDGLFTDNERDFLREKGLSLAPSSREKMVEEEFFIYLALTRASDKIFLSYPLANDDGRALSPSIIISRIKEIFPNLKEEFQYILPQGDGTDLEFINHPERSLGYLASKIREFKEGEKIDDVWFSCYDFFLDEADYEKNISMMLKAYSLESKQEFISKETAKKIFGNPLRVSVSRLEKYRSCPFSHFLSHGLKLKERQEMKLDKPQLGSFFHKAMEDFALNLSEKNIDWADLDKQDSKSLINEVVDGIFADEKNLIFKKSSRYQYLSKKFRKTLENSVDVLREHSRRGKFKPLGLEIDFGRNNGEMPGLTFELEDGTKMSLVGQIDRADACEEDDKLYIRVIDYKSGKADLSLLEVYYGFKIQLITYLDILLENLSEQIKDKEIVPAGIFYFYLRDPILSEKNPLEEDDARLKILKELKLDGYSLKDLNVFFLTDSETEGGMSALLPVGVKKKIFKAIENDEFDENEDYFHGSSKLYSEEQILLLRRFVKNIINKSGEGIVQGNIKISPYKYNDFVSCQYCSYLEVCQFDKDVNKYRYIKDEDDSKIWKKIKGEVIGND